MEIQNLKFAQLVFGFGLVQYFLTMFLFYPFGMIMYILGNYMLEVCDLIFFFSFFFLMLEGDSLSLRRDFRHLKKNEIVTEYGDVSSWTECFSALGPG